MLKVRNQLTHDYDGVIVKEYCERIIHQYVDAFYALEDRINQLIGSV